MDTRSQSNLIHNNDCYLVNIQNFRNISSFLNNQYRPDGGQHISLLDNLDSVSFSIFVNYINDDSFQITPDNILALLKCALVYDCKNLYNEIQKLICQFQNITIAIESLVILSQFQVISEIIETFVAINYQIFMQDPNFIRIPCSIMHRIFTWYDVAIDFNTQPMINCFCQMANLYGMAATPLFLLFDYSMLPEEIITFIQGMTILDRDVIGPLVHYHLKKSADEKRQLINQVTNLESEYERLQMIYSQTEQRNRILVSKTSENESRKQALLSELEENESKCQDLQQNLDNIRANYNKSNDFIQKAAIDTRQTNMDIDDMELNIQALKKQLEDESQIKAQLAQQQQQLEKKMFNDDKKVFNPQEPSEKEPEIKEDIISRENYVEPLLRPIDFNDKDFEAAFINKSDLKFDLAIPPSLQYSLDTEGTLRMAELHIMWRNCQNGNARALTDYGTHILRTDPLSFDLGMNYLEMALEHDEPYALYNVASLIQNGKIEGSKEEVASLLAKAAKYGEPNSVSIVRSCVKVVEL